MAFKGKPLGWMPGGPHGKVIRPKGRTSRRGTMNKLEGQYSEWLDDQKAAGLVAEYWFEGLRFRLASGAYYTPDFLVMRPSGHLEIHETKGFMREAANVRLKVTSEMYWLFPVFVAKKVKGTDGMFTLTELPS